MIESYYFYNTFTKDKKVLIKFIRKISIGHNKTYYLGNFLLKNLSIILNDGKNKVEDKIIYNILKKKYTEYIYNIRKKDKQVNYDFKFFKNPKQPLLCQSYGKSIATGRIILNLLKKAEKNNINIENIKTYLDFGAGDGINAETIGSLLSIRKNNIHCLDIKNAEHNINLKNLHKKCDVHIYNGTNFDTAKNLQKLPNKISKNSISLITCFQVLHHIPLIAIDNIFKQMSDVLEKNGLVIIKEHDAKKKDIDFLQVVHFIFYIMNDFSLEESFNELGNNYTNKAGLTKLLKKNNFVKITDIQAKFHPTYNYFSLYQKL